ncbi:MAG: OmpA family protein [Planctomycetia bacterium]|nr:OmpA family protein [Planctomycetia bacterium]
MRTLAKNCGIFTLLALGFLAGCKGDPLTQQGTISDLQNDKTAAMNERDALRNRYEDLENANRKVTLELAANQQKYRMLEEEMVVLRKQLKDTADQLTSATQQKAISDRRVEELARLVERQGGVPITPNSSLADTLTVPTIPGLVARQEGNAIHIEIPGDKLFEASQPGLTPQGMDLLRLAAREVASQYPNAKVSIEGHTSAMRQVGSGYRSAMDQSTGQAMMVYEVFTRENLLPGDRLSVNGCGASKPLVSSGTSEGSSRNYRIELVVTP